MVKHCILCLMMVLLCSVSIPSQSKRKISQRKSAIVTFQSTESGSRVGMHYLKLNGEVKSFLWNNRTRFYNFGTPDSREWEVGAEWRISYSEPVAGDRGAYDYFLWSATFTGRILSSSENVDALPSYRDWNSFWSSFRKAVQNRDRAALITMMAPKIRFSDGKVSPSVALEYLDNAQGELWRDVEKAVATGTKPYKDSLTRVPTRVTNDNTMLFERGSDGKWRWIRFMGD